MPATWGDVISLIVISGLFFGCIAAFVYVTEAGKKSVSEKDAQLRASGVVVTESGVDIRLNKQAPSKADIIDAQSRALMKGGERLMRPGVLSAGGKSTFVEDTEEIPSAFSPDGAEKIIRSRSRPKATPTSSH